MAESFRLHVASAQQGVHIAGQRQLVGNHRRLRRAAQQGPAEPPQQAAGGSRGSHPEGFGGHGTQPLGLLRGCPHHVPGPVDGDRIESQLAHAHTLAAAGRPRWRWGHTVGAVNPRSRRLVVSGVLLGLMLLVVVGALWR